MTSAFIVRHVDLSTRREDPGANGCAALSIFWWKGLPLGARASLSEELPFSAAQLEQFSAEYAAAQLAARSGALGAPLRATYDGWPKSALSFAQVRNAENLIEGMEELAVASATSAENLSIVICTRDRGQALLACLESVAGQRSPPAEVIVVDNSADGNAKAVCDRFAAVRHVHEPRPGLSVARNTGVRASSRELIAFTDDDVEVHPGWTAEIARVFAEREVDAMCGLVLPARLDTRAQRYFQLDMGGFGSTFVPMIFEQRFFEETRPRGAHVWRIGAGANMAFRRSAFDRTGLFDERLGAGAAGCSEDSELWYRLLARGGSCLYEPRAVVFHHHRADWRDLKRQVRAYMRGHVAALIVQYDNFGDRGNILRIWRQFPAYFAKAWISALVEATPGRLEILRQEILGWVSGLQYAVRPGWRKRRAVRLDDFPRDDPSHAGR